jgi:ribokinase
MLLQLESPLEPVLRAARLGRKHGVTGMLHPAPARTLPSELLPLIDILIPNETETAMLSNMPVDTPVGLEKAAGALREQGIGTVILTLGSRGALVSLPTQTVQVPAFPVKAVDTTAAGDAFVGGFGVALAEGHAVTEAVRWGNAAGALAATRLGAQPSLPTRSELETMLNQEPTTR